MKIVMLNGQNHKGSTYHIGRQIIDKLGGGNEVTEFFFPKDLNRFCLGCYKCIEDAESCPFWPEKEPIIRAIDDADVIVVTTPTYCLHVSAPLKSFFDLTFDMWMVHRPLKSMFSKKAVIVSTSAGAPTRSAIRDVQDALVYWGVPEIYRYGVSVQAMNWESVSERIKSKIGRATDSIAGKIRGGGKPAAGIRTRFLFRMMGMMHSNGWDSSPVEKQYWKDNGWLDGGKPWRD